MLKIGNVNKLVVLRFIEEGAYLDGDDWEVFLPGDEVPEGTEVGDTVDVLIYMDTDGSPLATTAEPLAEVGEFACLRVAGVTEKGAFLDWGIPKDLFLPVREQRFPVKRDEEWVCWVFLDPKNGKPTASTRLERFLQRDPTELKTSQKVQVMIYDRSELGYRVIIDGHWSGLLYHDETQQALAIGAICDAYVMKVREDGKVDVSLRPRGKAARVEGREIILDALEKAKGYLPYHDKTPAAIVEKNLGVSKKKFKMILGELYKHGVILLEEEGIRLAPQEPVKAPTAPRPTRLGDAPSGGRGPSSERPTRPATSTDEPRRAQRSEPRPERREAPSGQRSNRPRPEGQGREETKPRSDARPERPARPNRDRDDANQEQRPAQGDRPRPERSDRPARPERDRPNRDRPNRDRPRSDANKGFDARKKGPGRK